MYIDKLLTKLERKFGKFAIPNLMSIVAVGMAIVFIMDEIISPMMGRVSLTSMIYFDKEAILSGQIWRAVTFIFIPQGRSALFLIFELYFLWLIGGALESQWGTFKLNMYFFTGMLATIIVGVLIGGATNYYLNLTLFIAFAILNPDFQIMIFFCIPVKMKYLALLSLGILIYSFFSYSLQGKILLLIAVSNLILYFGEVLVVTVRQKYRRYKFNKSNKR